jgi:hypothetical protein
MWVVRKVREVRKVRVVRARRLRRPARGAQRIKKKQGRRRWARTTLWVGEGGGAVETVETAVLVLPHLLPPRLFRHPLRAVTATAMVAVDL